MSTTATGLAVAWAARAQRAAETLGHAQQAPALFKPEYVEELQREYVTAMHWVGYWRAQAAS
jgi:hypothetical protein